jgi:hypothetical protein
MYKIHIHFSSRVESNELWWEEEQFIVDIQFFFQRLRPLSRFRFCLLYFRDNIHKFNRDRMFPTSHFSQYIIDILDIMGLSWIEMLTYF